MKFSSVECSYIPLAYALIHLSAFGSVEDHFHNKNLILPYFSGLIMVAISVPFPEARNRKGTESGLIQLGNLLKLMNSVSLIKLVSLVKVLNLVKQVNFLVVVIIVVVLFDSEC